jgi:ribosomal silencing factor RsfS
MCLQKEENILSSASKKASVISGLYVVCSHNEESHVYAIAKVLETTLFCQKKQRSYCCYSF